MYIIEINTTAYEEENFFAITNIELSILENTISQFIDEQRENEENDYMNDEIVDFVNKKHPLNYFEMQTPEYLSI